MSPPAAPRSLVVFAAPACLAIAAFAIASIAILAVAISASSSQATDVADPASPFTVVLGVAQDAGYPQTGCDKSCCQAAWADPPRRRLVSCLGLVDPASGRRWLFDATPDFTEQLRRLDDAYGPQRSGGRDPGLAGIFLTHAHIGHYTGLMYLGREVMGADGMVVYAMPRMANYLRTNGPWSQLVELGNIQIHELQNGVAIDLGEDLEVTPILVPHRDEFSETVGYRIQNRERSVLFIPDIDKWERWDTDLPIALAGVDRAYLDGSFFADGEIPGRDMAEISHPFMQETLELTADMDAADRAKLRFIHMNHTNPALDPQGSAREQIEQAGCGVADEGERFNL